ncbi:hypothetical protein [Bacillus cereus]|uniref:hypothetical protein n=1 Tax=Bacillus cereus TaxID=1396 RepID=UPI001F0B466D|nr:hypothetical protein [Bacillus cereus]
MKKILFTILFIIIVLMSLGYWKFFTLSGVSGGEKIQSIHSKRILYIYTGIMAAQRLALL